MIISQPAGYLTDGSSWMSIAAACLGQEVLPGSRISTSASFSTLSTVDFATSTSLATPRLLFPAVYSCTIRSRSLLVTRRLIFTLRRGRTVGTAWRRGVLRVRETRATTGSRKPSGFRDLRRPPVPADAKGRCPSGCGPQDRPRIVGTCRPPLRPSLPLARPSRV